jgi:DNA-binding protein YbaB
MKIKLLSTLLFFVSNFILSQTVKGRVVANNYAIANVEIINANSKELTVSDSNGDFSISAKTNDVLVFISKEHELKKMTINPKLFAQNQLIVELILNAEELNEVTITKMPSIKLGTDTKWELGKIDQYTVEKNAQRLNVIGVNKHTIENGMDFIRIGGMILGLFIKEKEKVKKAPPKIEFIALAKSSCDQKFYIETLKLRPEEIPLFLEFCDSDPKSKTLIENSSVLSLMDFLSTKNIAFKKL